MNFGLNLSSSLLTKSPLNSSKREKVILNNSFRFIIFHRVIDSFNADSCAKWSYFALLCPFVIWSRQVGLIMGHVTANKYWLRTNCWRKWKRFKNLTVGLNWSAAMLTENPLQSSKREKEILNNSLRFIVFHSIIESFNACSCPKYSHFALSYSFVIWCGQVVQIMRACNS